MELVIMEENSQKWIPQRNIILFFTFCGKQHNSGRERIHFILSSSWCQDIVQPQYKPSVQCGSHFIPIWGECDAASKQLD